MMFITGTEAMEQSYDVYYRDRSNGTKLCCLLQGQKQWNKVMMFITGTEAMEQSYDVYYRDRSNGTKL